jgi:hypothetical protein
MRESRIDVLAWPIGDSLTASTRHRLLKLIPFLEERGIHVSMVPGGKTNAGTALRALIAALRAECVLIQKKLLPSSYLFALRRVAKHLIYDFDDALYAPRSHPRPDQVRLAHRQRRQLGRMLHAAGLVIAGNEELARYARRYAPWVTIIPTGVDVPSTPTKRHLTNTTTIIGWIGSEGTMTYLDEMGPILERLAVTGRRGIALRVVSNVPYEPAGTVVPVENVDWSLTTETRDILSFDIGIMPLRDDEWSRGKCAFKALQMMALGVPVVASPVGANCEVIQDGANGFLAQGVDEWVAKLSRLIDSPTLREALGLRGKETAITRYSLKGSGEALASAIRELCGAG